MISLIAAIGQNRELGLEGKLIFHIHEDMQFFKSTTMGHPVLMGRKTFESIGHPLPGRTNYVVTSHPELLPDSVEPVTHLRQFLESNSSVDTPEVFVIGGAMVYFEALPYATHLYLTEVDASAPAADAFFPAFTPALFTRTIIKKGSENDLTFTFVKYTKLN